MLKTSAAPAVAALAGASPSVADLWESLLSSSIFCSGGDPRALLNSQPSASLSQQAAPESQGDTAPTDQLGRFVSVVLADTEDAWHAIFQQMGREYEEPKLVLFTSHTRTGCGFASTASGPFYCPEDRRVYIDLGFYRMLQERFGAPANSRRLT